MYLIHHEDLSLTIDNSPIIGRRKTQVFSWLADQFSFHIQFLQQLFVETKSELTQFSYNSNILYS